MKIGLIRHFKVNCPRSFLMTSKEFKEWETSYNESRIIKNKVELYDIKWDKCYASTLNRAIVTAEDIFKGEITKIPIIRETIIDPIFNSNIKLPYWFWATSARIAWFFNHSSQEENKKISKQKALEFLDIVEKKAKEESSQNILIVTHGFFMISLQKELKKRGFLGKMIYAPKNGLLYLYERQ